MVSRQNQPPPDGARNTSSSPSFSLVVIFTFFPLTAKGKFPNLKVKTLTVYNIMPGNVPAGMNVNMITKQLEISVRGPADQVDEITAENIMVIVDFAEAERGTSTMRADVTIDSEFADVGVVGSYSVTASLRKY